MDKKDDMDRRPGSDYRAVHKLPLNLRRSLLPAQVTTWPIVLRDRECSCVIVEYADGRLMMALNIVERKKLRG